jgi:hypothetical protein
VDTATPNDDSILDETPLTLATFLERVRADHKLQAAQTAARLTDQQLADVHRELVEQYNAHQQDDVKDYLYAIRVEHRRRQAATG